MQNDVAHDVARIGIRPENSCQGQLLTEGAPEKKGHVCTVNLAQQLGLESFPVQPFQSLTEIVDSGKIPLTSELPPSVIQPEEVF